MAMSPLEKWHRSNERAKDATAKAKQNRQDNEDLKNAGVYVSPDEKYLDEYGYVKSDAPQWYKNIRKAWSSNRTIHQNNSKLKTDGYTTAKRKRRKKTMERKPRKVKIKHSVKMRVLLEEHGIKVLISNAIEGYDGFHFLPNGRIRTHENDVISAFQFIHDYV